MLITRGNNMEKFNSQKPKTKPNEEERSGAGSESDPASGGASTGGSGGSRRARELAAAARNRRFFAKRPRSEDGQGSSSEGELASARKIPTSKRGGVRERGVGRGLTAREATELEEGPPRDVETGPEVALGPSSDEVGAAGGPKADRRNEFAAVVEAAIRDVSLKRVRASRSKAVVSATASIMAAAKEAGCAGPPASEVADLRAEVARLSAALKDLQEENGRLRADLAGLKTNTSHKAPREVSRPSPPPPQQQQQRQQGPGRPEPGENRVLDLVRQELAAFQARFQERFSIVEGIVLRPSLASGKAAPGPRVASYAAAAATPAPKPGPSGTALALAKPAPSGKASAPARKATKGKKSPPAQVDRVPEPSPRRPGPPATDAEWQVVGEKKKAAKAARKKAKRRRRKERAVAARLRAPKTAAVVITLQPDAVKKGVTYRDVLTKARGAVDLQELGITGGLRHRVTATGARMLEIPGASSGPTADALAEKLRASLDAEEARVSRPVKCADMRIMGLDDSVTEGEVVAAVVRTGGCHADQVKAGTIRPDFTGMRTLTVSCPVTAASKIMEGRRLLVGWVSAQVKLLEPRP